MLKSNLFLIVFLAGGLWLVYAGGMPWWLWAVMTLVVVIVRYASLMDPFTERLTVSDEGLLREHGSRRHQALKEEVRWADLSQVDVLTHETGPRGRYMLFLLFGSNEEGVAVSEPLADQHQLLAQLRQRLPGFSEEQLAQAKAATGKAKFTLWAKDAPPAASGAEAGPAA